MKYDSVIAERVETIAQRVFPAKHVRTAYQGYLFSPPLPADEFEEFMLAEMDGDGSLCSAPILGNILVF